MNAVDTVRLHPTQLKCHKCVICHKAFTRKNTLRDHMLAHNGDKPFQCLHCDKAFTRINDLNKHESGVHQGIRPFVCGGDVNEKSHCRCQKTFKTRNALTRHQERLTGISSSAKYEEVGEIQMVDDVEEAADKSSTDPSNERLGNLTSLNGWRGVLSTQEPQFKAPRGWTSEPDLTKQEDLSDIDMVEDLNEAAEKRPTDTSNGRTRNLTSLQRPRQNPEPQWIADALHSAHQRIGPYRGMSSRDVQDSFLIGIRMDLDDHNTSASIKNNANPFTDSDFALLTNASSSDAINNSTASTPDTCMNNIWCWDSSTACTEKCSHQSRPEVDEIISGLVSRSPDQTVLFLMGIPDSTAPIIQESSNHVMDPKKLINDVIITVETSLEGLKTLNLDIDLQSFYSRLVNSARRRRRRLINHINLGEDVMGAIRQILQTSIDERKSREEYIRQRILIDQGNDREDDFRSRLLKRNPHSGDAPLPVHWSQSQVLSEERRINELVRAELAEQNARNNHTYTVDWLRDSLRAALAARDFCKTISSGCTGSSAESVLFASAA